MVLKLGAEKITIKIHDFPLDKFLNRAHHSRTVDLMINS